MLEKLKKNINVKIHSCVCKKFLGRYLGCHLCMFLIKRTRNIPTEDDAGQPDILILKESIMSMQLCIKETISSSDIVSFLALEHPSGTSAGWSKVIITRNDMLQYGNGYICALPIRCDKYKNRLHVIVLC